jgi:hypothetical protein
MDLFEPTDSEQAITTATALLAWMEPLDQGRPGVRGEGELQSTFASNSCHAQHHHRARSDRGAGTARLLKERQLDRRKEDG